MKYILVGGRRVENHRVCRYIPIHFARYFVRGSWPIYPRVLVFKLRNLDLLHPGCRANLNVLVEVVATLPVKVHQLQPREKCEGVGAQWAYAYGYHSVLQYDKHVLLYPLR